MSFLSWCFLISPTSMTRSNITCLRSGSSPSNSYRVQELMKRDLLDVSEGEASCVDDGLLPLVGQHMTKPRGAPKSRCRKALPRKPRQP